MPKRGARQPVPPGELVRCMVGQILRALTTQVGSRFPAPRSIFWHS
ncbi:hypothetical protein AB0D45_03625 [Streptomyces sp. NPDC048352]